MRTNLDRMARYVVVATVGTALPTSVAMGQEPVVERSAQSRELAKVIDRSNWAFQEMDQSIAKAREILGIADQMGLSNLPTR